jgi:chromosome segregation ATPase
VYAETQSAQQKLKKAQEQLVALQADHENTKGELEAAEKKALKREGQARAETPKILNNHATAVNTARHDLANQHQQLSDKPSQVHRGHQSSAAKFSRLRQAAGDMVRELKNTRSELVQARDDLQSTNADLQSAQTQCTVHTRKIEEAQAELMQVRQNLSQTEAALISVKKEVAEAKARQATTKEETNQCRTNLEETEAQALEAPTTVLMQRREALYFEQIESQTSALILDDINAAMLDL